MDLRDVLHDSRCDRPLYVKVDDQCDIVVVVNSKIKLTTHAPVDI